VERKKMERRGFHSLEHHGKTWERSIFDGAHTKIVSTLV